MNALRIIAVFGAIALPTATALSTQPDAPGGADPAAWGSATAQVLHELTREPLAGIPVTVVLVDAPADGSTTVRVFKTGPDGTAFLSPLEDGVYETYVDYNNHMSNIERFEINTVTDFHPFVTLYFNPDIDPG
jgi:hypothetical protein